MPVPTASAESGAVTIVIQLARGVGRCPGRARLETWIRGALETAGPVPSASELTLRIVDERESAVLNERYRGRTGPTNVLSFRPADDWPSIPGEAKPLGDLVVCAAVVRSEAAGQGKPAEAHWAHIVVHGTLHLLGHDHETPTEAERMEAVERAVLAQFGFADPYSETAGSVD